MTQIDSPLPRQVADTYVDALTELNPIKGHVSLSERGGLTLLRGPAVRGWLSGDRDRLGEVRRVASGADMWAMRCPTACPSGRCGPNCRAPSPGRGARRRSAGSAALPRFRVCFGH
ncbi:hypothetical protein GCM10010332_51520 [Streptomyces albogriseolus]|nr:hypothetical protein GCM10010332_51520 [Streptomyces albogriseolus]